MTRSRRRVASTIILTLILGLLAGFSTIGAVNTEVTVTTDPGSGFVVGQSVKVTWTLTAQTTSTVAFDGILSVRIKSPGSATWDVFTDNVATSGASFSTNHTFTPTKAGTYTIEGEYAGCGTCDPVLNASPVASSAIDVSKAQTTVTIAADTPDPSVVGQPFVVSGRVTPENTAGEHTNSGSVDVSDGLDTCTDTTLDWNASGYWEWSCSLTSNTAGAKTITATYSDDANYSAPTPAPTTPHMVNQAATTTTVTSSDQPSVTGQSVTFTATVESVAPGAGTPTGTVTFYKGSVMAGNEIGSPTARPITTEIGGQQATVSTTFDASEDPVAIFAVYGGDTNCATSTSAKFTQNVNRASTTMEITGTALGTSTDVGETYTVRGTVTPANTTGTHTTTGTVVVSDGTDTCSDTTLVWGNPVADKWNWSCDLTSTTAGAKTITASYSGDTNYQPSSDTESHTVDRSDTTVAITTDLTAATVVGEPYTVSGTVEVVSPGGGTPTGGVTVSDGTDTCGDTTLVWDDPVTGKWNWSCTLTSNTAGAKTITATYSGDTNYNGDEDTSFHTVSKADTVTEITGTDLGTATVVGEPYTVNGTVEVDSPGGGTPTGTVTVNDGTVYSSPAPIETDGSWSCTLASKTEGAKTIIATYSGDTNYNGDSDTDSHIVNKANTTVTITEVNGVNTTISGWTDAATVVGQSYTVSGAVAPEYIDGTHTTTGTVTVSDGTSPDVTLIPLTWSVDHWEWSCSFVSTTVGTPKSITAEYLGDGNYNSDATVTGDDPGPPVVHTVNQADTTTTVTSIPNPSVTGQSVTFTATVESVAPGAGTPTGTVSFYKGSVGGTSLGSGTLVSGVATLSSITFNASEDPVAIFAVYGGDTNCATSTSTQFTQNVNRASTTMEITGTALGTSTDVGETYTVRGTLSVDSPGAGTPSGAPTTSGTVQVSDGTDTVTIPGANLTWDSGNNRWNWSTDSLCGTPPCFASSTAGVKTITATYAGDADYSGSTASTSHTVDKNTVTISITPTSLTAGTGKSFTATLSPTTATGDITFQIKDKNGITLLNSGPHTLSSGTASSNTLKLSASDSPVSVTATYSGDDDFAAGQATQAVDVYPSDFAITSDDPDPSPVGATITVTWNHGSGGSFPEDGGLVISMTDTTHTATKTVAVTGGTSTGSTSLDTTGIDAGTWDLTATYTGTETTSSPPSYSDTAQHTVTPRETETSVSGPSATCVSQPVLLTATVTDKSAPPDGPGFTGTISWSSNGSGIFDLVTCEISQGGQCSTYYTPVAGDIGTVHINASYSGDDAYGSSTSPDFNLTVNKRSTKTTVFGSDTPLVVGDTATFLVTVSDTSSCVPTAAPTGNVSISVSPSGKGVLVGSSHTLVPSDGGQFTFTYTPTSDATTPHTFTATYTGSAMHNGSYGTFAQAIAGRAADIQMTVAPTTAYVYQPVTIAIHVEDDTTAGASSSYTPTGKVELSVDDGSGEFNHSDGKYTLDASGNCTATYTPSALFDDGTDDHTNPLKTITATYLGSDMYAEGSTVGYLNVILRPTTTTVKFATSKGILVNEHTTFSVTVADASGAPGSPPRPEKAASSGDHSAIGITKSLDPKSEGHVSFSWGPGSDGSGGTNWVYAYYRSALDSEGGAIDIITATYTPSDGVYEGSNGVYGKDISRRPTQTTISNPVATATGITYDVAVVEDSKADGHGDAVAITGDFVEKGGTDLDETTVGAAPTATGIVKDLPSEAQGTTLLVNATVHYMPDDRVHMTSLDSVNVDRSAFIEVEPPTDPSNDGSDCNGGCGDGGTNIEQILFNLNAAVTALHATQMGLDAAAIIGSIFPDPVWTAGFGFESGTEVPVKDIGIAILDGANLVLEVAIVVMETDLDGDGLPDVVEENTTHTKYNKIDSDSDGMDDLDEIDNAGGYYGGTRRPDPNKWDSDGDGLGDGDEGDNVGTSFCVQDTDCDGVTDWQEYTTYANYDTYNDDGTSVISSATARTDTRDQCEPLVPDTDGDGLPDGVEYDPGKLATSQSTPSYASNPATGYSPFVNDDDSDGDGILDGNESINGDAIWDYTQIGGTGTIGSGETHLCLADTDGDGLLDGEEEALFGRGPTDVHSTLGTITTPALDDDSDDDGLSDYEEQVITNTDPLNWDTDDDGISDADELIATSGSWPARKFIQSSDPLDPDTDDDGLTDYVEYGNNGVGTGLGTLYSREPGPAGDPDINCPLVNDDDSDNDGLQDGTESWNGDDTITTLHIGDTTTQATISPTTGETDFCNPDTDGDGLADGLEVTLLGGLPISGTSGFTSVTPEGVSTVVGQPGPDLAPTVPPLDDDSDNDGLSDYEEVNITGTDPLDQDTDNDTIMDSDELIATGGTTTPLVRSFDQESDPLDIDTDDDGLIDPVEYPGGSGLGTTRAAVGGVRDLDCPYVNDDDSDDDGLQDGVEDANHNGAWGESGTGGITIGRSDSQATKTVTYWETKPCVADTDGDGLLDGEEASLIGGGPVVGRPVTWPDVQPSPGFNTLIPEGVSLVVGEPGPDLDPTVPALDDDCDNDGLSDYEEVNVTHTDPLDADSDNDTISDANELICTGGTWPQRTFDQESDPLDIDTDDDGLTDNIEWDGSGLGITRVTGGTRDLHCPYVNDDDSDDDGLQDGVEDANHDGTWGVAGAHAPVGSFSTQADVNSDGYYETDLCNPDTDGDGLLDGEEVSLIGGGPILGRPATWPNNQPSPGFNTVSREAVSTALPLGTSAVPGGYSHTAPSPGTGNDLIAPYTFAPAAGTSTVLTVPALDVDSDDDGLSDYEEVNITGTDPLDQDSDNDTLMDADELIATGGVIGATPRRTFDQESDPLDINTDDDHLFDPQEYAGSGLSQLAGATGGNRDTACPLVNNDDSDNDGIQDGAVVPITPSGVITSDGTQYSYTHYEDFIDLNVADVAFPGVVRTVPTSGYGEQQDDTTWDVCDSDSDGDGMNDGDEIAIGTNPDDWDTDDDGRNDWHEVTGGGPIPTDPFDPDTDDDGLLDSAEVFGTNNTNPTNADTDGDGLCDGGAGTPWMTTGDARVVVNPICKSCSDPGLTACGNITRAGSVDGIGDHPNPHGYGEDKNGNGTWEGSIGAQWTNGEPGSPETDPNQYDTDGDADGDGVEVLGFSTSRQYMIPPTDIFGRPITVVYPDCGCLEPLIADTDQDGLEDGYEDRNHDGNFDFLPSEFDHQDPLPGPPIPYPTETNPCDPDTDHDQLTDWEERNQRQPLLEYPATPVDNDGDGFVDEDRVDGIDNDGDGLIDEDPPEGPLALTFNPTNPLDHDTDNDRIYDGPEVYWICTPVTYAQLDNDGDALIDEDPVDGLDNDGDGLIDEDGPDFFVRFVSMLDPTNRDSDSDGFIDGLDDDPCNSELIPILQPLQMQPIDTDGDGFSDDDEIVAGTHPNDSEDYPNAYCKIDLDFDQEIDDRLWLEPTLCCGIANSVAIDIDSNVLIDARVRIIAPRDVKKGDFDGDGSEDDYRYVVEYAFSNYRVVQPRIILTIDDYDGDLVIDHAEVVRK